MWTQYKAFVNSHPINNWFRFYIRVGIIGITAIIISRIPPGNIIFYFYNENDKLNGVKGEWNISEESEWGIGR